MIVETVAEFLHQTAEPGESIRYKILKRNVFSDGLQSRIVTFVIRGVSQAAVFEGLTYTVNYGWHGTGTQANLLSLFQVKSNVVAILEDASAGLKMPPIFYIKTPSLH